MEASKVEVVSTAEVAFAIAGLQSLGSLVPHEISVPRVGLISRTVRMGWMDGCQQIRVSV